MPYEELDDLPDSVKRNLPKHAREIYRAAYNSAKEQYGEEDRAHRVAWSAVEQKYEKNENGEWVSKENESSGFPRRARRLVPARLFSGPAIRLPEARVAYGTRLCLSQPLLP